MSFMSKSREKECIFSPMKYPYLSVNIRNESD